MKHGITSSWTSKCISFIHTLKFWMSDFMLRGLFNNLEVNQITYPASKQKEIIV